MPLDAIKCGMSRACALLNKYLLKLIKVFKNKTDKSIIGGKMRILKTNSYKIGINEVLGLKNRMFKILKPVQKAIKDKAYWNSVSIEESEYLRRDGFIPHSHNCGGLEIQLVVPKCEEYDFGFLEFGECDICGTPECVDKNGESIQCGYEGEECASECDGHLDAKLRVWFKFEGIENGKMNFYLYMGGGNGDAPYFRVRSETTIFEAEFSAKTLAELEQKSKRHIKKLLKTIGEK